MVSHLHTSCCVLIFLLVEMPGHTQTCCIKFYILSICRHPKVNVQIIIMFFCWKFAKKTVTAKMFWSWLWLLWNQSLKENHPRISISDGPMMQCRGKKSHHLMSTIQFQMGFTAVDPMILKLVMAKNLLVWLETPSRELQIHRLPDVSDGRASYNYSMWRNKRLLSFWPTINGTLIIPTLHL